MKKLKQAVLFVVPRVDSRFTRETLRRGGPYEVQGKRWRGRRGPAVEVEGEYDLVARYLPHLKKVP